MNEEKINIDTISKHWVETSNNDFKTMVHLFESKDYSWSLFIGHLVIEKLLKSAVVRQTQTHSPFLHDLRRLAKLSGLEFPEEYLKWLDVITTFNLNARYDNYKKDFYQKCTPEFTSTWFKNIKELRKWIKQKL
jgi:HEPN domain-containing protein